MIMNKKEILKRLNPVTKAIQNCQMCPLCETRTNAVPGRGSGELPPNIMFIGEAPGAKEDEEGKPFVGRSGNLLKAAIAAWKFENYFITNLVKCRPPENRNPSKDEVSKCFHYLAAQINILKPKSIVLIGLQAQNAWDEAGIHYDNVYKVKHPAYYLRKGWAAEYHEEFTNFVEIYKSIDSNWTPF